VPFPTLAADAQRAAPTRRAGWRTRREAVRGKGFASHSSVQLRVATLNAWGLPEPIARHVPQRMRAIGARLAELGADVVALQEIWLDDSRDTLVAAGRAAGLEHSWSLDAMLGGSGLLVLSRLPIREASFEPFSIRALPEGLRHIDFLGGKGFAYLRLDAGGIPLGFVNTHLQARYRRDVEHQYRAHRTGQVVQLALRARGWEEPCIAVGDFNFEEGDPEYRVLTGLTGWRDAAAALDRREPTVLRRNPYRSERGTNARKDLILTGAGASQTLAPRAVRRIFDSDLDFDGEAGGYSNHYGVLADLELVPRSAGSGRRPELDREAVALAAGLLEEGRRAAERRRLDNRAWAGMGLGGAALAAVGVRRLRVSRRRLLRLSLTSAAFAGLAPGAALSILSEVYVPDEIRAFDELAARLADGAAGQVDESLA
jgi:endonuclease/exonuclease/phosphatase family metal-dependent hydrolase